MRWIRFGVILLLVTLFHAGNLSNLVALSHLNIKPNFLLIILVFFEVNCNSYDAIIASFIIGFAADITQAPIGPYIISFGLFGTTLSLLRKVILMHRMIYQASAIFITGSLAIILAQILAYLKGQQLTPNLLLMCVGTALYSAAIGPYVYWLLSAATNWLGIKRYRFATRTGR